MKLKRIGPLLLAASTAVGSSPALAAPAVTVPTGTAVQLGDNIAVAPNAVTETELYSLYEQSREDLVSNNTDIDSNLDELFSWLLPGVGTDPGGSLSPGGSLTPGGSLDSGGSLTPGGSLDPGGSLTPGGSLDPGGSLTPGGSLDPGGSLTPGGSLDPGGSLTPGGSLDPGGSLTPGGSLDPGGSLTPGGSLDPGGSLTPGGSLNPGGSLTPGGSLSPGGSLTPGTSESTEKRLPPDKFKDLLDRMPNADDLKKQYEDAKKRVDENRRGNTDDAKAIKDAFDKASNGVNPFTGEKFKETADGYRDPEGSGYYDGYDDALEGLQDILSGDGGGESWEDFLDDYLDIYARNVVGDNDYFLLPHKKLDESEYKDDELVYEEDEGNINDIHYRCAKCGQLYGFNMMCACRQPKYLDGETYYYVLDSLTGMLGFSSVVFKKFNSDGNSKNNTLGSHIVSQPMECSICGKNFTIDSVDFSAPKEDRFHVATTGVLMCHECYTLCFPEGSPNTEEQDDDRRYWVGANPADTLPYIFSQMFPSSEAAANALVKYDDFIRSVQQFGSDRAEDVANVLSMNGRLDEVASFFRKAVGGEGAAQQDPGSDEEMRDYYEAHRDEILDAYREYLDYKREQVVHWDDMISPCTPDFSQFHDMEEAVGDTVAAMPDDAREAAQKAYDAYKSGSEDDWEDAFKAAIKNLPEEGRGDALDALDAYKSGGYESFDEAVQAVVDSLPDDRAKELKNLYDMYKDSRDGGASKAQDAKKFLEENMDALKRNTESGKRLSDGLDPGDLEGWSPDDLRSAMDAMKEAFEKGVPPESYWESHGSGNTGTGNSGNGGLEPGGGGDVPRIKDTEQYEEGNANKVFPDWPADRGLWTDKQRELYEEFKERYGDSETLDEMVQQGVFSKDKSKEEVMESIDDYIAGFTSIDENVRVTATADIIDVQDAGRSGSYDVKGTVRATVRDSSGATVAVREAVSGIPMFWLATETGRFTIDRTVDVYHIEWSFKKCVERVSVTAILPDGTSMDLISGREVTRIVEDKDSMKQTNCRTVHADSFTVNVIQGDLDINKSDFYDTERIR